MQIMAGMMELNGCRIIVKEIAGGKMVLDTRIKSYDPIRKVVKVSAGSLDNRMEHAVTVIIFGPNGSLVEATGNLRKVIIANEVEIELGRSKNGEKRKHVRYPLKEKGYIDTNKSLYIKHSLNDGLYRCLGFLPTLLIVHGNHEARASTVAGYEKKM